MITTRFLCFYKCIIFSKWENQTSPGIYLNNQNSEQAGKAENIETRKTSFPKVIRRKFRLSQAHINQNKATHG